MYEELAKRMITSITEKDIQKINAYQRTLSAGISTDKMRLLKDKSTENIGIIQAIAPDLLDLLGKLQEPKVELVAEEGERDGE